MALPFIEKYITRSIVLQMLIHYRCKEAEKIQRALVIDNLALNGRLCKHAPQSRQELYDMFPPRRQWVHLSYYKRKDLSQKDKNEKSLLLTVYREDKREGAHPDWYDILNKRIENIMHAVLTSKKLFRKPTVTVIEKKRLEIEKIIECRPVCLFKTLDERIYASLYNKVFSHLFDSLFYEHSIAFRVPKKDDPEMLHLKAIRKIKEFRRNHSGILYVAECDLQKFYDTLEHDVIKKRFNQLLQWKKNDGTISVEEKNILKNVIYSYVDCYCFYRDVYKYNKKPNHPIWKQIEKSDNYKKSVMWILPEIEKKRQSGNWSYRTKLHERYQLGVPQGGALSGVIANVLMHFTDLHLRKCWDAHPEFLYIRFCDDIIMMGKYKDDVVRAFHQYFHSVESSHLYIHPEKPLTEQKMKDFWNGKTKPPYQWGAPSKDVFPWITFVGYDINWEGETRIRRSTLRKEIRKQYDKRIEVEHLLNKKGKRNPQWSKQFISNSVHKRLIGMSVGRVPIWDYRSYDNKYSWAKAFTDLTDNPWSRAQLRLLDKHRNLMMKRLDRFLLGLDYKDIKPSDEKSHTEAVWYFGKPFSYYGQVLKKWD